MHPSLLSALRRASLALAPLALVACAPLSITRAPRAERWGFTVPWDPPGPAASRHTAALDAVVSGWIALDTITGQPVAVDPDTLARAFPSLRKMAVVTTFAGGRFHTDVIRRLAMDSTSLRRAAQAVASLATRGAYRGVVLDFEGLIASDSLATRAVVAAISRAVRAARAGPVVVAIPASDTAAYPARHFDGIADLLLVMLYDQHWPTSPPGPIAAPDWVRRTLGTRVAERGASRLVAALPLHGYLWRPNAPATTIAFDDARRLAAEGGISLVRDPASQTLHGVRAGSDGWELWVSDAVLVAALEREVAALGVRRLAFWRLGLEDPATWTTPTP